MSSSNGFWWWSSGSGGASADFDRLLETCTSSNLPSSTPPPITHSLTLSDLIRSSAVSSSHAVKSLQKRLAHPNPNVQLLVISVIDVCVKNGGDNFIRQIGSREFSEDCAQIISNPISNAEVKEKLKREFQNWALAFEAVPFLASSELVVNYRRLKTLGIDFPPKDPLATAAMVDSMSAPEWRDSDVCDRCRTAFSFTNRKHHCRNCGGVFDGQCSSKKRALPHFGVTESVRICDGCERSLAAGITDPTKPGRTSIRRNSFSGESSLPSPAKLSFGQNHHQRSATIHSATSSRAHHRYTSSNLTPHPSIGNALSREEADLERAIALSLKESSTSQRPSFPHSDSAQNHQPYMAASSKPQISSSGDETNDPDLAAAIAASLRDAQASSNPHPSAPMSASPATSLAMLPLRPSVPPQNASEEHINALLNFSADVDTATRLGQLFPTNADLHNRHAQAEVARLDFNRDVQNAERKTQTLREMNDKLSQAVKLYDRLLRDQIQYRTGLAESSAVSAPGYPTYRTIPPFQPNSHYGGSLNQVSMPINNQASMYPPQNSNPPHPHHAVPVGHNFTSIPQNIAAQVETTNPTHHAQTNQHLNPSSGIPHQQVYPALLQPTPPIRHSAPAVPHQHQSFYSQECSAVGLSQPLPTAASHMALSPAPKSPYPEDAQPANTSSPQQYFNNSVNHSQVPHEPSPANGIGNLPGAVISLPPTMSRSPVTLIPTNLTEHNQHVVQPHHQFSALDFATSGPSSQQSLHGEPASVLSTSVDQLHPVQDSSFPSAQRMSSQPIPPAVLLANRTNVEPASFHPSKPSNPEFHSAIGSLPLPAASQTSIEPSSSSTYFPSFPNVPNTQLTWSSSNSPGPYHHHTGIDVPSVRQEEVAPLIEL